jgi:hypothetical protein
MLTTWVQSLLTPSGVWSLVTMAVSVGGLWLGGIEPRWSWWWGIGAQAVWLVAGIATHRPGDVILSIVFVVMYVRNLRRNRGASYRRQGAMAAENERLRRELAELRSRCGGELKPAGVP